MAEPVQHLEHRPRQAHRPLDRLIRIRIRAERQRARLIPWLRQLALEQRRHVRLEYDLGLELQTRRVAEIGVARPRITIDAAVLAPAVRIDRAVEAEIRAVVPSD